MTDIPDELVQRMVKLVVRLANRVSDDDGDSGTFNAWNLIEELRDAKSIEAELPKPIDPDLLEARKLVASRYHPEFEHGSIIAALQGKDDDEPAIQNCLIAIKRGRELAKESNHDR